MMRRAVGPLLLALIFAAVAGSQAQARIRRSNGRSR